VIFMPSMPAFIPGTLKCADIEKCVKSGQSDTQWRQNWER
jgi:hypothetical protein